MGEIGYVLGYDMNTLSGVISTGERRFPFKVHDWKYTFPPRAGMQVDFVVTDGMAKEVFPTAQELRDKQVVGKSKIAAGLFGIFLGGIGIHRFYLGYIGIGIVQIVVTCLTCGIGAVWGFIEGILILADVMKQDAYGNPLGTRFS